jgi:hypothetical protein
VKRPRGIGEIRRTFGDPRPYIREDGTIAAGWEKEILDSLSLPAPIALSWDHAVKVSRIRCHRLVAPILGAVFQDIWRDGLWPTLREFGGCYAWRVQRGSDSKLSTHSWGISIDLNPSTNQLGTEGDWSPRVLEAFERHGFLWGGTFGRPDPMHWQYAEGF